MPASSSPSMLHPRVKAFLLWALLLLMAGYVFLDYWDYSRIEHSDPVSWQRLVKGVGIAPAQYRIGVYFPANAVAHLTHLAFRHIFASADALCLAAGLAVLFFLLAKFIGAQAREVTTQWAIVLFGLLLTQVYLGWALWFQEPETMPSLAILAASSLLCSGHVRVPRAMIAVSLLLVAGLGATIRVDAVVAFHAGMLLAAFFAAEPAVPIGRLWQIGTSAAALIFVVGIERYIAHSLFPHALREAALIQLGGNLRTVNGMLVPGLALPAWVLTLWLAPRYWPNINAWQRGLVIGSLLHFAMYAIFGMTEEVRIFLPFALVLMPVSAVWLTDWFQNDNRASRATG